MSDRDGPSVHEALREAFGVSSASHDRWMEDCSGALASLRAATDVILKRQLREGADKVCRTVDEIIHNCGEDPDDIREEIALPTIVRKTASVLERYVEVAARDEVNAEMQMRLKEAESLIEDAAPALTDLLVRMRANDERDFSARVKVMSSIFGRLRDAVKD